jgi:hypothetical protein
MRGKSCGGANRADAHHRFFIGVKQSARQSSELKADSAKIQPAAISTGRSKMQTQSLTARQRQTGFESFRFAFALAFANRFGFNSSLPDEFMHASNYVGERKHANC